MADRYDLITSREGKDGKKYWNKVGVGFKRDKGGYSIVLESYPLPDKEGRVSMLMVPPKENITDEQFAQVRKAAGEKVEVKELDDSIPF